MKGESRVKKSLLNARVNLICYFVSLLIAFFTRKTFINYLGTEFVGLTGTLQSILGFLNLAELGISGAISFVLYKPIFDGDETKINEVISVFGYLYRIIGLVILCSGVVLSAFLPLIFPETSFPLWLIYLGFFSYLGSSLLGYFVNYKQTLLSADQRNYEVTGYYQGVVSVKVILQMILALYLKSFVLFLLLEITFSAVYSAILSYRIRKVYPWLESDVRLGKKLFKKYPEIGKYIKQLFVHKIGELVQGQTSPILVYAYTSLPLVAVYENYNLIMGKLGSLMNSVMMGTNAGVGNLISEGNQQKIWKTYLELFFVRGCIASFITGCTYFLVTPFVSLWIGPDYVLSQLVVFLICLKLYLTIFRGVNDQFLFGYGLFYDVWAPLTESALYIIAGVVCGSIWGLPGVLMGPLLSMLVIVYIWKPYFLFSKGLKVRYYKFWMFFLLQVGIVAILYGLAFYFSNWLFDLSNIAESWNLLFFKGIGFAAVLIVFHLIVYLLFCPFRNFLKRFKLFSVCQKLA